MKLTTYVLALLILITGIASWAKHLWRGEVMSTKQVCQKWGDTKFDAVRFKEGNSVLRGKMSCSLLKTQANFLGKDRSVIRKELGDFDGFYFSDMFPTYIIEANDKESWQIVFLLNTKESVSEIIVHKNCCD